MRSYITSAAQKLLSFLLIIALAATLFSVPTNAYTAAAAEDMLRQGFVKRGIDVSYAQGDIDWAKVAQDNVHFAFIRASYWYPGTKSYPDENNLWDKRFTDNVRGATENGIPIGLYHYGYFETFDEMNKEADNFIRAVRYAKKTLHAKITYPLVLDMEEVYDISNNTRTSLIKQFMNRVQRATGRPVMLYSYDNFFQTEINLSTLSKYDFWVANWSKQPMTRYSIWQYSNEGRVDGISGDVDMDLITFFRVRAGGVNIAYGDVNDDMMVDATDAKLAYDIGNGKVTPTEDQTACADVDGSGTVDASDAALIYAYIIGQIDSFPAES